jgi:tetratricopeptide (TPR) repeat protein
LILFLLGQPVKMEALETGNVKTASLNSRSGLSRITEAQKLFSQARQELAALEFGKAKTLLEKVEAMKAPPLSQEARLIIKTELPLKTPDKACLTAYQQADRFLKDGKYGKAQEIFWQLKKKYPRFEWAYLGLGLVDLKQKNSSLAAQEARSILAFNPNFVHAWILLIHEAVDHQDLEGAVEAAKTAHEVNPGNEMCTKFLKHLQAQLDERRMPD